MHLLRGWRRDWVLGGFVVLTLAIGIGANAAVFAVVDRLLLHGPEGVRDAQHVVRIYRSESRASGQSAESSPFDFPAYDALRSGVHGFAELAAYSFGDATLGDGPGARHVTVEYASGTLFSTLGATTLRGRPLEKSDDVATNDSPAAIISYDLWRSAFGGASVIGRKADIDDATYTIVGVADPGFTGPELGAIDVWLPLRVRGEQLDRTYKVDWDGPWLFIAARLSPGLDPGSVTQQATAVFQHAYAGVDRPTAASSLKLESLTRNARGKWSPEASVSFGVLVLSAFVLVIAFVNALQLMFARQSRRSGETAIRVALGASPGAIAAMFFLDSAIIVCLSALGAVVVSAGLSRIIWVKLLPDIAWPVETMLVRVGAAGAITATAIAVISGFFLWLNGRQVNIATVLRTLGPSRRRGTSRNAVITIVQCSLVVVLLSLAGVFARSLMSASNIDYGVDADRTQLASIQWRHESHQVSTDSVGKWSRHLDILRRGADRLRASGKFDAVSIAVDMPFHGGTQARFWPAEGPRPTTPVRFFVYPVDTAYFAAAGTPLEQGRPFDGATDVAGHVAVIGREAANRLWPGVSAVGRCLAAISDSLPCARVVGVAADVRDFHGKPRPVIYVPISAANRLRDPVIVARPHEGVSRVGSLERSILFAASTDIQYVGISRLYDAVAPQLRPWELGTLLFGIMGLLALSVAAVGMFGVVVNEATSRSREMAIRRALGAQTSHVFRLLIGRSLFATLGATVIGTGVVVAGRRAIVPLLFTPSGIDPLVLVIAAATLFSAVLLAVSGPAIRVTRLPPANALRAE